MEQIIFVLGLPGSGKSTAACLALESALKNGWATRRFCDYDILYEMYQLDMKRREGRFKSTEYDGFDVRKLDAFDDALRELSSKVLDWLKEPGNSNKLCIVEFARDDYCRALEFFDPELLPLIEDAYFLFVDADIPTCIKRIHTRVTKPNAERTLDDHFVSNYIFNDYYLRDHRQYLASTATCLTKCFHIAKERIMTIENKDGLTMKAFLSQVEKFVTPILEGQIPALIPVS